MKVNKLENVDFDKIILLGIEEVYGFDRNTGELAFAFDQIKNGELSGTNDTSYAEGKRGVRLATLKSNKTSSFTCENGYVIFSALARQLGSEVIGATNVKHVREKVKQSGASLTLTETPVVGSTYIVDPENEETEGGVKVLAYSTDYTLVGKTITLNGAFASGSKTFICEYDVTLTADNDIVVSRVEHLTTTNFTVTLSGTPMKANGLDTLKVYATNVDQTKKKLLLKDVDYSHTDEADTVTFMGDYAAVEDGTIFLFTYDEEVSTGKKIVNDGETFSEDVRLVINMLGQDICSGVQYLVQCIMPKASVSGEWNLSLGTDPAVHNFSAEASLDVCSIDSELCEFIVC